jgi:hypothetical protein
MFKNANGQVLKVIIFVSFYSNKQENPYTIIKIV